LAYKTGIYHAKTKLCTRLLTYKLILRILPQQAYIAIWHIDRHTGENWRADMLACKLIYTETVLKRQLAGL
jgi:hypothetical protein